MTLSSDTYTFLNLPIERTLLDRAFTLADRKGEGRSDYLVGLVYRGVVADESETEAAVESARLAEGVTV